MAIARGCENPSNIQKYIYPPHAQKRGSEMQKFTLRLFTKQGEGLALSIQLSLLCENESGKADNGFFLLVLRPLAMHIGENLHHWDNFHILVICE